MMFIYYNYIHEKEESHSEDLHTMDCPLSSFSLKMMTADNDHDKELQAISQSCI